MTVMKISLMGNMTQTLISLFDESNINSNYP